MESNGEEKEIKKEKKPGKNYTETFRENPWIISTFVLGLLAVILIIGNFSGGITGNAVSEDDAGDYLISYLESQGASGLTFNSIEEESGFYKINLNYQGSVIPFYVTKTGYFTGNSLLSIIPVETSATGNVPKSDVPEVELFIWGYCPYGVQAQGPLAEVAGLLQDYADFKAVLYYDGHGPFETQENKIQECIQEIIPEKYWDYAAGFVENIYPKCSSTRDVDCDKTEAVNLMNSLGIDSDAVLNCVDTEGDKLLSDASARAKELGVTGSPTLVVNGVRLASSEKYCSTSQQNAGQCIIYPLSRTAEDYKTAVCDAFNDAPDECSVSLSSSTATTSGSC